MNDLEFIASVTHRAEQRASGMKFSRQSVFSIKGASLQRLADKVAADPKLYTILFREYSLTLTSGSVTLAGLSPTLLLSKEAREHWHVTLNGERFPLQRLASITDKYNAPQTPDYRFYIVYAGSLQVFDVAGSPPVETAVTLCGNYVPLITDAVFSDTGELKDDLLDTAVALLLESQSPQQVTVRAGDTAAQQG